AGPGPDPVRGRPHASSSRSRSVTRGTRNAEEAATRNAEEAALDGRRVWGRETESAVGGDRAWDAQWGRPWGGRRVGDAQRGRPRGRPRVGTRTGRPAHRSHRARDAPVAVQEGGDARGAAVREQ